MIDGDQRVLRFGNSARTSRPDVPEVSSERERQSRHLRPVGSGKLCGVELNGIHPLKTTSVSGWRAGEMKCRRSDAKRVAGMKCRCLPLTEANAPATHAIRKGRAGGK